MSCNRENVIWIGRDGKWNRGFYEYFPTGGPDHEWDVEYDYSRFMWVSTGWATEDQARASWNGANPGGYNLHDEPSAETDEYDQMARECQAAARR